MFTDTISLNGNTNVYIYIYMYIYVHIYNIIYYKYIIRIGRYYPGYTDKVTIIISFDKLMSS